MNIKIEVALLLEKIAKYIKTRECSRHNNKFLIRYGLIDSKPTQKTNIKYNSYESTNLYLIDALIKSKEILVEDKILDIGSGTGLFLLYLASKKFKYLYGFEIDYKLVDISIKNINKIKQYIDINEIDIKACDATEQKINDNINVIYMFNTFYDKDTYIELLKQIEESLQRNYRKLKIIILYPTIGSMGAMRTCNWLIEKGRVFHDSQVCGRCVNFLIYETSRERII